MIPDRQAPDASAPLSMRVARSRLLLLSEFGFGLLESCQTTAEMERQVREFGARLGLE